MVKLSKKIISNKLANEAHSKDFSKLAKSTSFVDDTRIKEIYNGLFYTIPVGGKNSHKNIVEQSDN